MVIYVQVDAGADDTKTPGVRDQNLYPPPHPTPDLLVLWRAGRSSSASQSARERCQHWPKAGLTSGTLARRWASVGRAMRPGRWGQAWVVYRGGMCVYWLTPTHHARPPGPARSRRKKQILGTTSTLYGNYIYRYWKQWYYSKYYVSQFL